MLLQYAFFKQSGKYLHVYIHIHPKLRAKIKIYEALIGELLISAILALKIVKKIHIQNFLEVRFNNLS